MELPLTMVPSGVRQRERTVRAHRAQKYRALLLRDVGNNRLRKRYLDYRTADLARADVRLANHRLALAGAIASTLIVVVVGALGGALGALILAKSDRAPEVTSVALALGSGGALCGAVGFALLALRGWVMFAELIGEIESAEEPARGAGGALTAALIEAWGGLLWGTVCGMSLSVAAGVLCRALGFLPATTEAMIATGAATGLVVGTLAGLAQVVTAQRRGPNAVARDWGRLGPLPLAMYVFSFGRIRRMYLR